MPGFELFIGGWVASPVIKSVLKKIENYLGANYDLQKGTEGMVNELTDILLLFQATVIEAEKNAIINNQPLVDWLRSLKKTIYDAEDVLDNMEAKSIKEKVQGKNKVRKVASGLKNVFIPDNNYKRLKKVVDKLKDFSQITHFLELLNKNNKNESQTHEATDSRENISQPLEEVVLCGREDELNQILEIILGSGSESSKKGGHGPLVIPIVGMGGVGKTTLAQAVYNNPKI
ncbi:Disease resistance protein RGA2 [Carex littledalei]|uniref:Disease resistance protein RGA2 n=1 Tax=Carex littledalei TaxID=544730 RepID=A0A833RM56_9POAL|nr:Disease resistance protein RGA2 [Carex littledalei]